MREQLRLYSVAQVYMRMCISALAALFLFYVFLDLIIIVLKNRLCL